VPALTATQVLVIHDMLGLFVDFTPKFVKRYADLKNTVTGAAKEFIGEVKEKKFPTEDTRSGENGAFPGSVVVCRLLTPFPLCAAGSEPSVDKIIVSLLCLPWGFT